jgi:hypothetical protein
MKTKTSICAVVLAFVCADGFAQDTRAAVFVDASAPDVQEGRLVYAVKGQIRRSASMRLVDAEKESGFQLRLNTLDPDNNNYRTIYSMAVTLVNLSNPATFSMYLDSTVGSCGANVIDQCANSIVARADTSVSGIRAAFASQKK